MKHSLKTVLGILTATSFILSSPVFAGQFEDCQGEIKVVGSDLLLTCNLDSRCPRLSVVASDVVEKQLGNRFYGDLMKISSEFQEGGTVIKRVVGESVSETLPDRQTVIYHNFFDSILVKQTHLSQGDWIDLFKNAF